jgi:hypothetical protein
MPFIEMPFITRPWPATPDPFREARAEFRAPAAHGFVRQGDASLGQQQFNVAEAQTERVIQPYGVTDDLRGEPVAVVRGEFELHPPTFTRRPAQRNAGLSVNLTMPSGDMRPADCVINSTCAKCWFNSPTEVNVTMPLLVMTALR